jgi:hypothetical protein
MAHIVGGCANAILPEIDNQDWQCIVAVGPIGTSTLTGVLINVIGELKGMGFNSYETTTTCYHGWAKKTAPGFAISNHHL